jgi:hypothetical protein
MSKSKPERISPFDVMALYLSLLVAAAVGQNGTYPHNAVSCERCHSAPNKFGSSVMTVQRTGFLIEGDFIMAPEGGIHHRSGESAQSSPSTKQLTGERVSLNRCRMASCWPRATITTRMLRA